MSAKRIRRPSLKEGKLNRPRFITAEELLEMELLSKLGSFDKFDSDKTNKIKQECYCGKDLLDFYSEYNTFKLVRTIEVQKIQKWKKLKKNLEQYLKDDATNLDFEINQKVEKIEEIIITKVYKKIIKTIKSIPDLDDGNFNSINLRGYTIFS